MKRSRGGGLRRLALPAVARRALPLAALLGAAGCLHVGPPGSREPVDLYDLTPYVAAAGSPLEGAPAATSGVLAIDLPQAPGALAADRIAVRPGPHRLVYLAAARWAEAVPPMLQRLLVESLAACGRFAAVAPREVGLRADLRLVPEILAFEVRMPEESASSAGEVVVEVRLSALLLGEPERRVLAARAFGAEIPAASRSRADIVAAFDEAFHAVAQQLVEWSTQATLPAD